MEESVVCALHASVGRAAHLASRSAWASPSHSSPERGQSDHGRSEWRGLCPCERVQRGLRTASLIFGSSHAAAHRCAFLLDFASALPVRLVRRRRAPLSRRRRSGAILFQFASAPCMVQPRGERNAGRRPSILVEAGAGRLQGRDTLPPLLIRFRDDILEYRLGAAPRRLSERAIAQVTATPAATSGFPVKCNQQRQRGGAGCWIKRPPLALRAEAASQGPNCLIAPVRCSRPTRPLLISTATRRNQRYIDERPILARRARSPAVW